MAVPRPSRGGSAGCMHWRHERLSVAMPLADALHHSAQPKARPRENEEFYVPRQQQTPPARGSEFFIGYDEEFSRPQQPAHHGSAFCGFFRTPYALDDEEFFVEGSGWRGRRESDPQVFCHTNSVHASAGEDKLTRRTPSSAPPPQPPHLSLRLI